MTPGFELLDDDHVAAVLRDLRFPIPEGVPGWSAPIRLAAGEVSEVPGEPVRTFAVQGERVRHRSGPVETGSLVCSCAGRTCVHVAAVLLSLARDDPRRRAVLEAPSWEVALSALRSSDPARSARGGRLRYDLWRPTPGQPGLVVEPWVLVDGRTLRYPRRLDELEALVSPLAASDRELHPVWLGLEHVRRLERHRNPVGARLLSRLLLGPLSSAADVRLDDVPVRVSTVPVAPRIVGTSTADGLGLRWEPVIRLLWADAGIVLTADGEVRPLADGVSADTAARLLEPLPTVPGKDVRRFVEEMVVDRGLAITLPEGLDPVTAPHGRASRLALSDVGGDLEIGLDLVYLRDGLEARIDPDRPTPTVRIRGAGRVVRDLGWEQAEVARFAADVPVTRHPPGAALSWLRQQLPALAGRWEVHGEERLLRFTVRGTLSPAIRFSEREDWFDLDVVFTLGPRQVDAAQVLQGWLRGDRTVRLDDGSLAELPLRWLQRHGRALDLLGDIRRAQRKLGSWHAWTVCDLLEEVGDPAERWLGWVRSSARDGMARRPTPPGLQAQLRPYQQQGFEWLCFLRDHGLHGLLADEMGLGKTVQALAVILDGPRDRPALVVAPTSVLHGWLDEAARFAPELRAVAWHGSDRRPEDLDRADLVVTTYALLRRDVDLLGAREWSWAVLDEGQHIKNPASQTARAARRLRAHHRLVLTGTPLENDLLELWSLFQFLMPGYLGRRSAFHARYAVSGRSGDGPALDDLTERIRPFVLRRKKAKVAKDLPPRTEIAVRIPLSDRERALYEAVKNTVRESLQASSDDPRHRRTAVVLEGLTRLRQACCHPALLPFAEARLVGRSSKLEALLERLETAIPGGSRALVFSQWVRLLDEVADVLRDRGIPFLRLDGGTRDRAAVVRTFQAADGPPVFLISIKAGGTGLNLTAADLVFHLDPWWNPAVEDQATDRAHRIGQTRPVTVYCLLAADTVEERVLALQEHKRRLFEQTVDQPTLDVSALTTDDLLDLLQ